MTDVRKVVCPYTTAPICHGLGTTDVLVAVYNGQEYEWRVRLTILDPDTIEVVAGYLDTEQGWVDLPADTVVVMG